MGKNIVIIPHIIVLVTFILSPRFVFPLGEFVPSIMAAAYIFFNMFTKRVLVHQNIFIYILIICCFIYFRTIFTEDIHDTALVKLSLGLILGYLLGRTFSRRFDLDQVLKMIAITGLFNSILIILEFLIPELKDSIENLLIQNTAGLIYADHPFQLRGLASAGGAALSIFNFACVYILLFVTNFKIRFFKIFSIFVLSVSCVIIGRTGLLAIFVLLASWTIINIAKNEYKYFKIFIIIIASFLILYAPYFVNSELLQKDLHLRWIMEIFTLFDGLENKTLAQLAPMFFFPEGWDLIFGTGSFERQLGYVQSDVGYVKTLHFGGFIFFFLFYGFFIVMAIFLGNMNKKQLALLLTIYFIFELKEPFLVQNINSRFWFFIIGFIYSSGVGKIRGTY